MQWVQDLDHSNADNLNNLRREASRHFRNKTNEYLKAKTEEDKKYSHRDLYRGISDFRKGY
jgi:hypothetical protein